MIPPSIYLALGIAVVAFIGGWKVESWRWSASLLETERAVAAARLEKERELDDISARYERTRETLRQAQGAVRVQVDRIVEKPVYRDGVCLDDDGLHVLNSIGRPASDRPGAAGTVP